MASFNCFCAAGDDLHRLNAGDLRRFDGLKQLGERSGAAIRAQEVSQIIEGNRDLPVFRRQRIGIEIVEN